MPALAPAPQAPPLPPLPRPPPNLSELGTSQMSEARSAQPLRTQMPRMRLELEHAAAWGAVVTGPAQYNGLIRLVRVPKASDIFAPTHAWPA